jgi:hypothetical protein
MKLNHNDEKLNLVSKRGQFSRQRHVNLKYINKWTEFNNRQRQVTLHETKYLKNYFNRFKNRLNETNKWINKIKLHHTIHTNEETNN